jgi:hypothetical protein
MMIAHADKKGEFIHTLETHTTTISEQLELPIITRAVNHYQKNDLESSYKDIFALIL